ncbi:uncharacterized protein LOC143298757 [Babylonia areolata]|uniref:uncharacterized protein LOC143298757 n=1 Tax=Babylonia areolata TaxID=304850 RepID=UPI003FCF8D0B
MNSTQTALLSSPPPYPPSYSPGSCSSLTHLQCATLRLWQVVTPIIVVLGLLGNLLVVVIFSRLHFTKSSTLVHLFVLAVTDSVIMCLGPTRYWVLNVFDYDVRMVSSAGCKLHLFLLYVSLDFSAWILVSVSVERALCVAKPLHVRGWFTVRRTLCRLVVIFVCLTLVNGHYFFSNAIVAKTEAGFSSLGNSSVSGGNGSAVETSSVSFAESYSASSILNTTVWPDLTADANDTQTDKQASHVFYDCDSVTPEWETFEEMTFVYIDLCFNSLGPFLIMVVCNSCIIFSLRKHSRHRPRRSTRRGMQAVHTASPSPDPIAESDGTAPQQDQSETSLTSRAAASSTGRLGSVQSALLHRRVAELANPSSVDSHTSRSSIRRSTNIANSASVSAHSSNSSLSSISDTSVSNDCVSVNCNKNAYPDAESTTSARGCSEDSVSLQGKNPSMEDANSKQFSERRLSRLRQKHSENCSSSDDYSSRSSKYRKNKRKSTPTPPPPPPDHSTNTGDEGTAGHLPGVSPGDRAREGLMSTGVTRMLVLVTVVFLLTTLPSAVYYIADSYVRDQRDTNSSTNQVLDLCQALTNLLQFSNYGVNFLLYSSRSKRFRLEVKYLLGIMDSRFRRHFQSSVLSGTKRSARQNGSVNRRSGRSSRATPTTSTPPQHNPRSPPLSSNGHLSCTPSATETQTTETTTGRNNPAFVFVCDPEEEVRNTSGSCRHDVNELSAISGDVTAATLSSASACTEGVDVTAVTLSSGSAYTEGVDVIAVSPSGAACTEEESVEMSTHL